MNDAMPYTRTTPPDLVTQRNLTPFLRASAARLRLLAAKADADPAGLTEEVFEFCDVRSYRPYDMLEYRAVHPGRAPALANPEAERLRERLNFE